MNLFKGKARKIRDWLSGLTDRELEDEVEVIQKLPPPPKSPPPTPPTSTKHPLPLVIKSMVTAYWKEAEKESMQDLKPIDKSPVFTSRLRSILKDNMTKRRVSNKTYGDIDHKRLYRISTSNKVFSRAEIHSLKGYNIGLVVDCSGSMRENGKAKAAAICAMTLVRDFQGIANVAVLGFNVIQMTLKELQSSKIKEEHLSEVIGQPIVHTIFDDSTAYGNHDHAAIKAMHKILLGQKGDSIMVVLSDGQPTCGSCRDESKGNVEDCGRMEKQIPWLKEALAAVTHSRIVVLGIGIVDMTVKGLYKEHEVVKDPNNIYDAVLKLFSRTVKRRAVR